MTAPSKTSFATVKVEKAAITSPAASKPPPIINRMELRFTGRVTEAIVLVSCAADIESLEFFGYSEVCNHDRFQEQLIILFYRAALTYIIYCKIPSGTRCQAVPG
jgi:hypothetical protein